MKKTTYLALLSAFFITAIMPINAQTFDGYALYNSQNSNTTYLIDKNGSIAHSWSCAIAGNYTVHLKENGNLVRGGVYSSNQMNGAAVSGIIQELDANANVVWQYIYSTSTHVSHHDFTVLPNGNVIITAWEVKTGTQLLQAGWSGSTSSNKWPTHFVELQPDGAGSATIVWEWHIWDHMIQDHNATKDNFGVVANNPQLMDINAVAGSTGPGPSGGDWFHVNGIDYNPTLDQLVFTSRYASEFFIIDHSTTTAQAASHTGGNSGKGGDFLYRYGNAPNFGSTSPQIIPAAVHDPRWIKAGRPNAGYIQFFNNNGGGNSTSTVDAINPPVSGNTYSSYTTPTTYNWRHTANAYSSGQSAHDKMTNGNTFVSVSNAYMYEVNSSNTVVWQYSAGPAKAFRYECDYAGLAALLGNDPCGLSTSVQEFANININIFPNPSNGIVNIVGLSSIESSYSINVYDIYGKQVLQTKNESKIDLSNYTNGVYIMHIINEDRQTVVKKIDLIK